MLLLRRRRRSRQDGAVYLEHVEKAQLMREEEVGRLTAPLGGFGTRPITGRQPQKKQAELPAATGLAICPPSSTEITVRRFRERVTG